MQSYRARKATMVVANPCFECECVQLPRSGTDRTDAYTFLLLLSLLFSFVGDAQASTFFPILVTYATHTAPQSFGEHKIKAVEYAS